MRLQGITFALALIPVFSSATAKPPIAVPEFAAASAANGDIQLYQSPRRVMVMMQIGDGQLVPMIFDTGSDGHSIDRLLVIRERLQRVGTTKEIDGTTGKIRFLPRVALKNLTVGGLPVQQIEAAALDYDRTDAMVIFTPEMFTDSLVYVDLANSVARLRPRASAMSPEGSPTPYVEGLPGVAMVMPDGSKLKATFDTGFNGALSLPTSMMKTVPLMAPPRVVGRFKSINTEGDVFGARIRGAIKIGPVTLDSPEVTFLGEVANVGLPVIRQVTLVLDPGRKHAWVLSAGSKPSVRK